LASNYFFQDPDTFLVVARSNDCSGCGAAVGSIWKGKTRLFMFFFFLTCLRLLQEELWCS